MCHPATTRNRWATSVRIPNTLVFIAGLLAVLPAHSAEARQFAWEATGGPEIGFVEVLHRHSDGTLIAASGSGNVYWSSDDGVTWQPSMVDGLSHGFQALASLPSGNIVAGAGEQGTFRSSDGGRSFQKDGLETVDVSSLFVADDGSLFIGTTGTDNGRIIRSTDEGETGFTITNFGPDASVRSIAGVDGIYVAALESFGNTGGIAVSTNGGINWTRESLAGSPQGMDVAVDATGNFFVAVNDWDTKTQGEIYRSTDGAGSWDVLDPTPNDEGWVQRVVVEGDRVLVTSDLEVLTVSMDAGATFTRPSPEFYPDPRDVVTAAGGDLLMTAAPLGIYRSTDDGYSWQASVNGFVDSYIDDMARGMDGTIYAAAGGRLFRSETGMGDWSAPLPNDDVSRVGVHFSGTVYTGGNFTAGIRRSSDGGDTWTTLSDPALSDLLAVTNVTVVPGGEVFAAGFNWQTGGSSFVRSTDNGASWGAVQNGPDTHDISAIRQAPNGNLYLTTLYPGGLFTSSDRGATWTEISTPNLEYLNDIVFHPDGTIFIAGHLGAHRSSDGGSTWTLASGGLPEFEDPFFGNDPPFLRAIAITSRGELFGSAADGQVYRSLDKGTNWTPLTDGPGGSTGSAVPVLAIYDGRLYAGTAGSGVVRTTGSVVSIERITGELPSEMSIGRNYPNPFSASTTLEFGLDEAGPVLLRVYDTLGREVARLVDRSLEAGVHRVVFDGAGLPAGTYIYRLSSPSGAASRTMTLLK